MNCGVGRRCSSDPTLLWLWCRPAALIRSLAWELPYVMGVALKRRKKERKKERQRERERERKKDRERERKKDERKKWLLLTSL